MSVWVSAWVAALVVGQSGMGARLDAVDSGDKAWAMGQPKVIANGVETFDWSPDGQHVIYTTRAAKDAFTEGDMLRSFVQSSSELWAYSIPNQRGSRLLRLPQGSMASPIEWLANSQIGLVTVSSAGFDPDTQETTSTQTLYAVGTEPLSSIVLMHAGVRDQLQVLAAPNTPRAIVQRGIGGGQVSDFFLYDGAKGLVDIVNIPPSAGGWFPWGWKDDENFIWFRMNNGAQDYMRHNPVTGDQAPLNRDAIAPAPPATAQPTPPLFRVDGSPVPGASELGSPASRTFYLMVEPQGESPLALVTASAEQALLRPQKDYVVFLSDGTLYQRQIKEIDRRELIAALERREAQKLMMQAKQVGIALIIYAADYDGNLPSRNIDDSLQPYLKNREVTANFVFNLPQTRLDGIEDPSAVEMGHIDGKYGRAIVYADGHVRWLTGKGGAQ